MKPSKGKRLLLALVLWASLLPVAGAAGTGTTEYGMGAESLAAAGPAPSGKLAVSQPLGETGVLRQKDLKAELLAGTGNSNPAAGDFPGSQKRCAFCPA